MLGLLGAETLFSAAERADLVLALSDHVQRVTLNAAAGWTGRRAALRLALNLTANDVQRHGFADLFIDRVDASGFPRDRLTVEITEGGLIDDLSLAADLFARFRAAGIRVAIDDFGTGYSSLAYLKALPLDYLKIDKRMAQDITGIRARPHRGARGDRHGAVAGAVGDRRRGRDGGAAGPAGRARGAISIRAISAPRR